MASPAKPLAKPCKPPAPDRLTPTRAFSSLVAPGIILRPSDTIPAAIALSRDSPKAISSLAACGSVSLAIKALYRSLASQTSSGSLSNLSYASEPTSVPCITPPVPIAPAVATRPTVFAVAPKTLAPAPAAVPKPLVASNMGACSKANDARSEGELIVSQNITPALANSPLVLSTLACLLFSRAFKVSDLWPP